MLRVAKNLRPGSIVVDVSDPSVPLVVVARQKTEWYNRLSITNIETGKNRRVNFDRDPMRKVFAVRRPDGSIYWRSAAALWRP